MSAVTFEQAMAIADKYVRGNLKQLCQEQLDIASCVTSLDDTLYYRIVVEALGKVKPTHEAVVLTRGLVSWHAMEHVAKGS